MDKKEAIKLGKATYKFSKKFAKASYKAAKKFNKEMKKNKKKSKMQQWIEESEDQFDYKKWE